MIFPPDRIWCVIPVYNNGGTLAGVVRGCRKFTANIVVVDDGSTDLGDDAEAQLREAGAAAVIRHERNLGKGAAILSALAWLRERGAAAFITIDADGQHDPDDLPGFFSVLTAADAEVLVLGCRDFSGDNIPGRSRFGRRFADFWLRIETGRSCDDCQSGFRAYPVAATAAVRCLCRRYNFETEVLTRLIWGGIKLVTIPVRVHYPEQGKRISHFRPVIDNLRISLIHAHLVGLRLLPLRPRRVAAAPPENGWRYWRHPVEFLRMLLHENSTPGGLAAAAAAGTFLAVLPIPGFHSAAILYVTARLHLNKALALAIQNLFMPPVTPFLCIELGYYLRYGEFLTELSFRTVVEQMPHRLWEWLLGSLLLAPLFSVVTAVVVGGAAALIIRRRRAEASK